jgi:hypothetical protein
MRPYQTPGVYPEKVLLVPPAQLPTGVPALLGFARKRNPHEQLTGGQPYQPERLTRWPQFEQMFCTPLADGYLAHAVRGFFENGGRLCYVLPLDPQGDAVQVLHRGLAALATLDVIDLVCAPDIMHWSTAPKVVQTLQEAVLDHCATLGDRFAILDALPVAGGEQDAVERVLTQADQLNTANGALYFPWLDVGLRTGAQRDQPRYVPPCGHVAGVYAASDERIGVHKAPANERLAGVLDLQVHLTETQQGDLNSRRVNCLRSFRGRGIRVWGARTLSQESAWTYVNTRRLFLTAGRWVAHSLVDVAFEPNDPLLWARVERELTTYFGTLFQRGALKGRTMQEAFYVRCDATTNPPEGRDQGAVITEIGLAPSLPNEFVVVRIIHGASGVTLAGPNRPG